MSVGWDEVTEALVCYASLSEDKQQEVIGVLAAQYPRFLVAACETVKKR